MQERNFGFGSAQGLIDPGSGLPFIARGSHNFLMPFPFATERHRQIGSHPQLQKKKNPLIKTNRITTPVEPITLNTLDSIEYW
jgi:hypothetical protein